MMMVAQLYNSVRGKRWFLVLAHFVFIAPQRAEAWTESIHDEIVSSFQVTSLVFVRECGQLYVDDLFFSTVLMMIWIGYFCSGAVQLPYHTATDGNQ